MKNVEWCRNIREKDVRQFLKNSGERDKLKTVEESVFPGVHRYFHLIKT